jgi:nucleotide-binding universal stress UspA family protein
MYRKIIVGHDLHSGGEDALAFGREITRATGAQLVVAGVFPTGALPHGFEETWVMEEERVAREIQRIADAAGAEAEGFPSSSPAAGLHGLAEEIDADLVVVGSSRHSKLGRILAGDVGLGLLHGAPCTVAIAPRGYAEQPHKELATIVVGLDGSHEARLALEDAVELAAGSGATVKLVAVVQEPPAVYAKGDSMGGYQELKEAIEEQAREHLDEALSSIPTTVTAEASLVVGDPEQKLAQAASGSSLLILGSRGYGPLRRVLLGSVATALMRNAACPVLVHPRGVENEPAITQPADAMTVV